jgi:hypothetical protein
MITYSKETIIRKAREYTSGLLRRNIGTVERIPGPTLSGVTLCAIWRQKKAKKYWRFSLDYGEIDTSDFVPLDQIFHEALGSPNILCDIFNRHRREQPSTAHCSLSWQWMSGNHLTEALVTDLRECVRETYRKAAAALGPIEYEEMDKLMLTTNLHR